VAETFPDFESIGWFAAFAPSGTPHDIVGRLNQEINAAIRMPDIVERFAVLGVYPSPGTPEQLGAFVVAQRRQWKAVIDAVGLEPQ